jgi:hypothetical protein
MRQFALVLVLLARAGPAAASVVTTGDVDPGGATATVYKAPGVCVAIGNMANYN